jgi:hypothetical protein
MSEPPDLSALIAKVAALDERTAHIERYLERIDRTVEELKTAHHIQVGKGVVAKLLFATIPGGLGAAIVKLVDWLHAGSPPG